MKANSPVPFTPLFALSPLDGRYHDKVDAFRPILSEFGLIRYRVKAELAWFIALADNDKIKEVPPLSDAARAYLDALFDQFSEADANWIKEKERKTNHDVKAVEYFLKDKFSANSELAPYLEFIHFACTSEDINNVAYSLMMKESHHIILQAFTQTISSIEAIAIENADLPMLSRTHGQPASPTTLGKEFENFARRFDKPIADLKAFRFMAKMNGAVGNYNAHLCAYPEVNWPSHSEKLITDLGLDHNSYTTQIEPHDQYASYFNLLTQMNTILIGFCRDIWSYNSIKYFKLKITEGETGSSTMPHKVNPIDFENAEGNLGLANAMLRFLSDKLPISRMQRDLTDSTVLRNIGVGIGYTIIALSSLQKGIHKLEANEALILDDLNNHPEVLGEAIQTVMRRYGIDEPYEKLKALTRGHQIDLAILAKLVDEQSLLPDDVKTRLKELTPATYTGLAASLAKRRKLV